MALAAGTKLGPYEIIAPIGAGGMGEVYRARDTKLKRDVALKVLPEAFARDSDRMTRFQREAEVLASLNHPNIAQIYGLEERALVMELVEGENLPGPLPVDTALEYARQIAEALEYAHERGVIHRDLKPANVKVTPEGVVKLLDFGLAKALEDPIHAGTDPSNSPTLTLGATRVGVILGTAAYMSPEQASGKPADRRADIWSFGAVLFEMLAGKKAFAGHSASDTLASVLKLDPEWAALPASTPVSIQKLVRRCLIKERKQRLQSIGEARIAIEEALSGVEREPEPLVAGRDRFLPWALAGALSVALVGLSVLYFRVTQLEAAVVSTTILPPDGTAFAFLTSSSTPVISPDGRKLAFGAQSPDGRTRLWIRPLNSRTAQPLTGTESARFPFWSPDSKIIGFFAAGKLKTIDAGGGPTLTIADAPLGHGGTWSPQGVIVFSPVESGPLQRVPASGGTVGNATWVDERTERTHHFPCFLPDGRHFVYTSQLLANNDVTLRVAELDSKETKTIGRTNSNAIYADGRLLFLREDTLMAQPFDLKRLATTGDAVPVAAKVAHIFVDPAGLFSASNTGFLVYQGSVATGGVRLTWSDRNGKPSVTLGEPGDFTSLELSPDQKRLAASVEDSAGNRDIWIYDVARGLRTRFTFDPALDSDPLWSPDGSSVVFRSLRRGHSDLFRKPTDGTGAEEVLYSDQLEKTPGSWSPDGKFLLYSASGGATNAIWALPVTPQQAGIVLKPFSFVQTAFPSISARFSPDGRWVAYQSNESQQFEVYVASFHGTMPAAGGKLQISTNGGTRPRWRRDGKEIFYLGLDARLMAAEVSGNGSTIEVGQVRSLGVVTGTLQGYPYDVSADGQRFLVATAPEQNTAEPLTLVQNWNAGLKK